MYIIEQVIIPTKWITDDETFINTWFALISPLKCFIKIGLDNINVFIIKNKAMRYDYESTKVQIVASSHFSIVYIVDIYLPEINILGTYCKKAGLVS